MLYEAFLIKTTALMVLHEKAKKTKRNQSRNPKKKKKK